MKYEVGDELYVFQCEDVPVYIARHMIGKLGKMMDLGAHSAGWIAIEGVVDRNGTQLWVSTKNVRLATPLDKALS